MTPEPLFGLSPVAYGSLYEENHCPNVDVGCTRGGNSGRWYDRRRFREGQRKSDEDGGKNDFDLQDRSEGGERNAPRLRQRVPDHNDKSPIVDRAR